MKKHIFTLLVTLSILLTTTPNLLAINGNMGGPTQDGSADFPYLIEDFNDFQAFCNDPNYWAAGVHTQLNCNLDLAPNLPDRKIYTNAPIARDTIGASRDFDGTTFSGIFDGNNFTIKNLIIDSGEVNNYLGLFGKTDTGSEIRNTGIENFAIKCDNSSGGLCGNNLGTIINCYAAGIITGDGELGGLCGENYGSIKSCNTAGLIKGYGSNGGLCGSNYSIVENCYSIGDIECLGYGGGGLCGDNSGTISNCYSVGNITGNSFLGGLCGINCGDIESCYATGSVSGEDYSECLGGLCGSNGYWHNNISGGMISNCYSTGAITGGDDGRGGLCGDNVHSGIITNCFWDFETSRIGTEGDNNYGATGKTTTQMKTVNTFLDADWDLVAVWNIEDGQTYPLLRKYSAFDTNYDSKVNFIDFAEFANHWLDGVE